MRTKTVGSINNFMTGEYKQSKKKVRKEFKFDKKQIMSAGTALLPLVAVANMPVFASSDVLVPPALPVNGEAVPAGAIASSTLSIIAHALDPVIDLLVAVSFPIASVVIIGSCFYFIFGNTEKAWSGIQNAGLGYIIIQLSPMLLNILREIGKAV